MEEARIEVRLRPGGRRDQLLGFRQGVLQASVSAPPLQGRANRALCRLIAKQLGLAPSRISVVRGARSRDKLVRVEGMGATELKRALASGPGVG